MYLVSPDYLNKNESPSQSSTKISSSLFRRRRRRRIILNKTRVTMKKGAPPSYDKWAVMRGDIEEAAVGRRALIKAIADFIKAVLPETTLAQKVTILKSESQSTQTVRHLTTPPSQPPRPVALPLNSSAAVVMYETETSPVSTRIAGATAVAATDDNCDNDYDVAGAVSE